MYQCGSSWYHYGDPVKRERKREGHGGEREREERRGREIVCDKWRSLPNLPLGIGRQTC